MQQDEMARQQLSRLPYLMRLVVMKIASDSLR